MINQREYITVKTSFSIDETQAAPYIVDVRIEFKDNGFFERVKNEYLSNGTWGLFVIDMWLPFSGYHLDFSEENHLIRQKPFSELLQGTKIHFHKKKDAESFIKNATSDTEKFFKKKVKSYLELKRERETLHMKVDEK